MPKKQRIYDYFSEFASEALHIVIFENFVKPMTSCLSKLKVTPSFCFAFKIPDDPTATIDYGQKNIFFRNKTFLFFKIESWNFQHMFEKKNSLKLAKFQLIQFIQTIFVFIFSIGCLIELKFCEVSQNPFQTDVENFQLSIL